MAKRFNIRVYGLLINENNEVLVSDEYRFGKKFTKFPGGGLEWGEGLAETIVREWHEEVGKKVSINELFFVNDSFQQSAFREEDQILSFYFLLESEEPHIYPVNSLPHYPENEGEFFRWMPIDSINDSTFRFPIDQAVGKKLIAVFDL